MDSVQMRIFVAISRAGSFRRAAAELQMAQPSVSQQIRRLESGLGVQLFDRTRRPVELTEAGRALLERAGPILEAIDDTAAEIKDFDSRYQGPVVIGAMQYLVHLELPNLLAAFRKACPDVDVHLRIGNSGEIRDLLVAGAINVALIHQGANPLPPQVVARALRTERLVLITSLGDPRAETQDLAWTELADEPFIVFREGASIREALMDACAQGGFTPRTTLESGDISTAVALVTEGLGVALVPESFALAEAHRVARIVMSGDSLTRTVLLAWDERSYQSRAMRTFRSLATTAFRP